MGGQRLAAVLTAAGRKIFLRRTRRRGNRARLACSCGSKLGEVFQRKKDRGKHAVFIRQLQPQQFVLLRLFLCRILVIGYYRIKQACKLKFI